MSKKLSREEVDKKIRDVNPEVELVGQYLGSMIKTEFKCLNGHKWLAIPDTVFRGSGCKTCHIINTSKTKESINALLKEQGKGYELTGEYGDYIGSNHSVTFKCHNGHTWNTRYTHVLTNRSYCQYCEKKRISKEEFNARLTDSGKKYLLVSEFHSHDKQLLFRCEHKHEFTTDAYYALKMNGCPYCTGVFLSKQLINKRLQEDNRGLEMLSDYQINAKSLFKCNEGHEFMSRSSVVLSGRGCPHCATYGFNPGIPGYGYLLKFDGFIKYGITNHIDQRLKQHLKNGDYSVCVIKTFEVGSEAREWETTIKNTYGGKYVTDTLCPDGWTETLPVTLLEDVSKTLM